MKLLSMDALLFFPFIEKLLYPCRITLCELRYAGAEPFFHVTAPSDRQSATSGKFLWDSSRIAWELRPSVLDELGVVPAIRIYIENYSGHYGIKVHFECNLRKRLEANKETTIYRVIQEALTNIGKYADVSEARVTVQDLDTCVETVIEDRGKGFTRQKGTRGVGLFSMEERARGVGGQFTVHSEPGKGTKVTLIVPK